MMVGYSQEFGVCQGKSTINSVSINNSLVSKPQPCRHFLNQSVEKFCDQHKYAKKMQDFQRMRAGRMNTMGDRVDINQINKQRKLEKEEQ